MQNVTTDIQTVHSATSTSISGRPSQVKQCMHFLYFYLRSENLRKK